MKSVSNPTWSLLVFLVLFGSWAYSQDDSQVILAGKLLDVQSGEMIENAVIIVKSDRIAEITSLQNLSNYPEYIDLSKYTVLPGLIDCHNHLLFSADDPEDLVWEVPIAYYGILGTLNARKSLMSGFTTVRDVWGMFYADVAVRDAINRGLIPGPRMYVSGPAITMTGGHGAWGNWMAPHLELKVNPAAIADGVDEIRKEVRQHVKHGVDLIKITASGGYGTSGSIPGAASYSQEELSAAVTEARKHGLRVAAHAHGTDGIKNAIRAGVTSIEHGSFLDEEAIALMKKNNTFLVMDLMAAHYDLIEKNIDYSDKKLQANNMEVYKSFANNFKLAYQSGVTMAFGTDSGVYPHGRNAEQFNLMVQAGMPELDAIRTATINASQLIGISDKTGSLEVGKWADIIAVKGNPLEDITALEKVEFVMKAGKIYKGQ